MRTQCSTNKVYEICMILFIRLSQLHTCVNSPAFWLAVCFASEKSTNQNRSVFRERSQDVVSFFLAFFFDRCCCWLQNFCASVIDTYRWWKHMFVQLLVSFLSHQIVTNIHSLFFYFILFLLKSAKPFFDFSNFTRKSYVRSTASWWAKNRLQTPEAVFFKKWKKVTLS